MMRIPLIVLAVLTLIGCAAAPTTVMPTPPPEAKFYMTPAQPAAGAPTLRYIGAINACKLVNNAWECQWFFTKRLAGPTEAAAVAVIPAGFTRHLTEAVHWTQVVGLGCGRSFIFRTDGTTAEEVNKLTAASCAAAQGALTTQPRTSNFGTPVRAGTVVRVYELKPTGEWIVEVNEGGLKPTEASLRGWPKKAPPIKRNQRVLIEKVEGGELLVKPYPTQIPAAK